MEKTRVRRWEVMRGKISVMEENDRRDTRRRLEMIGGRDKAGPNRKER